MSQPGNSDNNSATAPKEMSMEVRLLIAFLLMGAVMFLSPYFFKTQTPPPGKKTETAGAVAPAPAPPANTPAATSASTPEPPPAASTVPAANATKQQPLPPVIIDTD